MLQNVRQVNNDEHNKHITKYYRQGLLGHNLIIWTPYHLDLSSHYANMPPL